MIVHHAAGDPVQVESMREAAAALELDDDALPRLSERQHQRLLDDLIDAHRLVAGRPLLLHRQLGQLAES